MRKSTIVGIITAAVLFVAGIGMCIQGVYMSDFDFKDLDDIVAGRFYKTKTSTVTAEEVKQLQIDMVSHDVVINYGDVQDIVVETSESYMERIQIENNRGVLSIKGSSHGFHIGFYGWWGSESVKITLPRGKQVDIQVDTTSGDITIGAIRTDELQLDTTSGDIELYGTVGSDLRCNSTSGDIEFDRLDFQKLDMDTTSGDIEGSLIGAYADYRIETDTTSGDSNLQNQPGRGTRSFRADTTSGDIACRFISPEA